MNYQVIARKYRPQTFLDLTGQEHISRTLGYALDHQRLHHAYLFSGVRGTGKTTSARIFAKGLNCHQGVTSYPCLQCPSCLEIAQGNSLDVLEIDAASNTGVDNVRDVIINSISIAPARDRYKVFIIDEVHMLSNQAFNALLKTLEEPPRHVLFIMATTELHKVPDTILSRCQQFEFRQIPTEKIFVRLQEIAKAEQVNVTEDALRELARAGAGSLRDAQSALDQVIAFGGEQITLDDVTASLGLVGAKTLGEVAAAIARQDTAKLLELVEEVTTRGYDLRNFTRELMAYWRHLLVIKAGIQDGNVLGVTEVEIARLTELSSSFSEPDLVRGFHLLAETEKEIKDSPHPRFQLELGLVKLTQLLRLRPVEELLARLETLAHMLDGAALKSLPGGGASGSSAPTTSALSASGAVPAPEAVATPSRVSTPRQNASFTAKPAATTTKATEASNLALDAALDLPELPKVPAARLPVTTKPLASATSPAPASRLKTAPTIAPTTPTANDQSVAAAVPTTPTARANDGDEPDFPDFDPAAYAPTDDFYDDAPLPPPGAHGSQRAASSGQMERGQATQAIFAALEKRKQRVLQMALEDAQRLSYQDGTLTISLHHNPTMAKRLRDSAALFREIGQELFQRPIQLQVIEQGDGTFGADSPTMMASGQGEQGGRGVTAAQREQLQQLPAIQLLREKFRAEIMDVRERGAEEEEDW